MTKRLRLIPTLLTCLTILATAQTAFAQGRDFAGAWALDAEKSGTKDGPPQIFITQTAKEFTARFGGEKAEAMPFNLDGTEREVKERGATTKAAWKGDKLEATVKMPPPAGAQEGGRPPETITFSRDGAWLVIEAKMERGPMKLYFKKAPAK